MELTGAREDFDSPLRIWDQPQIDGVEGMQAI